MARTRKKAHQIDDLSVEERRQIEEKIIEQKRLKKLRNEITHKLRFEVLERDNFTCRYCGRSPQNTPGLTLEVDHIIPLYAGGDNSLDNLVTACWECNEGKKDKQILLEDKKYKLHKDDILKLYEDGNIENWKNFLKQDKYKDEREFLYDYNERINHPFCQKNCTTCIDSGMSYYIRCIDKLSSAVLNYDTQFNIADDIRLLSEVKENDKEKEQINEQKEEQENNNEEKGLVVVTNGDELDNTNDSRFRQALQLPYTNSKYDILKCDFCYAALRCPKYRAGASCAFNFTSDQNGSFDFTDPLSVLKILAKAQGERVMRGLFFEKLDGGALDKNVTNEMLTLMGIIKDIKETEFYENNDVAEINISAKGIGKKGTGVLSSLFKDVLGSKDGAEEIQYNEAEEAKIIDKNDDKN